MTEAHTCWVFALMIAASVGSATAAQTGGECEKLKALNEQTLRDLDYQSIPGLAAKMRQKGLDQFRLSDEMMKCLDENSGLFGASCNTEIRAYNRAVQAYELVRDQLQRRQQMIRDQFAVNRTLHPCG
jgi:hypothetical protein